ncbi:sigma factor [Bradyrhizobium sp. Leo170]|uniref:sigma factor n=1 Tax=Bradyrhizobium sp. Leo170 TaxID=1571199 RepID=UPI0013EE5D6D|nr:sigma factor [Bradyrhizobium sp. Leo170]
MAEPLTSQQAGGQRTVDANLTPDVALATLLSGTGLIAIQTGAGAFVIVPAPAPPGALQRSPELTRYLWPDLRARLTRQLGSEDFAEEALHETWLHLHRDSDPGQIQSPSAFLARIAENIAKDRLRAERRARRVEIEAALSVPE